MFFYCSGCGEISDRYDYVFQRSNGNVQGFLKIPQEECLEQAMIRFCIRIFIYTLYIEDAILLIFLKEVFMNVNKKMKKVWSILLTFCMLMSSVPVTTLAEENAANGLCEHHQVHTAECGYVEAVSGTPCTHICEENCYTMSTACMHTHDGTCSYQAATAPTPCGHVHDESCGYAAAAAEVTCACVPGEDGTLVHTEGCGYAAPVAEQPCTHTHDGNCVRPEVASAI